MTLAHQHLQTKYFSECNLKYQLDNNVMRIPKIGNNWSKGKSIRHNVEKINLLKWWKLFQRYAFQGLKHYLQAKLILSCAMLSLAKSFQPLDFFV